MATSILAGFITLGISIIVAYGMMGRMSAKIQRLERTVQNLELGLSQLEIDVFGKDPVAVANRILVLEDAMSRVHQSRDRWN